MKNGFGFGMFCPDMVNLRSCIMAIWQYGTQDDDEPLVGGFNPSEKYESQLGLLFPIYGKIKVMFQTTNQHTTAQLGTMGTMVKEDLNI